MAHTPDFSHTLEVSVPQVGNRWSSLVFGELTLYYLVSDHVSASAFELAGLQQLISNSTVGPRYMREIGTPKIDSHEFAYKKTKDD